MIKGHQRPIKIGKVCYKWMLLNSKKISDWLMKSRGGLPLVNEF